MYRIAPFSLLARWVRHEKTPAQRAGVFSSRLRRYWSLLAESFQDHGERLGRAAPVGHDLDRVTDVLGTDVAQDSVDCGHRFVVDRGDNIASLEPSSRCTGPGRDLDDVDAMGDLEVVLLGNRRRERSSLNTQSWPRDLAVLDDASYTFFAVLTETENPRPCASW